MSKTQTQTQTQDASADVDETETADLVAHDGLSFKRFGHRYHVVGSAAEIAAAVKRGYANVARKDETVTRVDVERIFVTKKGATVWTFGGQETAAFVPVDDRPKRDKPGTTNGKGEPVDTSTVTVTKLAPTSDPADLLAQLTPDQIAAIVAAATGSAPEETASKPAPETKPAPRKATRKPAATKAKATPAPAPDSDPVADTPAMSDAEKELMELLNA